MKKKKKAAKKKLVLKQEKVRNLSAKEMKETGGGTYLYEVASTTCNSAGATRPGPTHDTDLVANIGQIAIKYGG